MVKDRSVEFQTRARDDFEDVNLGAPGSPPASDLFQYKTSQVRNLLEELRIETVELKRKQEHVLAQAVVTTQHKTELELCIARIREKTRILRPRLQEIELEFQKYERDVANRSSTELRLRRNQIDLLRKKMFDVIQSFNESHENYKERVSKRVKRELQLAGENLSDPEVDRMLASHSTQVFYREVNPLSIAGKIALQDASARHEEILELERSLSILQEMFTDIHDLVHQQGDMVENIEQQVDKAQGHVEIAAVSTKQAIEYKKSATRKKIMCILIVIILVLILVVVAIVLGVVLSGKNAILNPNSPQPSPPPPPNNTNNNS